MSSRCARTKIAQAPFDSAGDFSSGCRRVFVLPDTHRKPARFPKTNIRIAISRNIGIDLFDPPPSICFWHSPMLGTAVPKTPIDKDRDFGYCEINICAPLRVRQDPAVDPEPQPQ